MARSKRTQALLQFGLFCGILLFVNILGQAFYSHLDLTEEKRYTLTKPTKELLDGLNDRVYIKVLLEGDFPAGFKRLQSETREMLRDFRVENGNIEFEFENPLEGNAQEVKERQKALAEDGIAPLNLRMNEQGATSQKLVYPTAIVRFGSNKVNVNLLENNSPTLSPDLVINNSVSLLEYKLANAIKKVMSNKRPKILFTRGHGELSPIQTKDLERSLTQFYDTDRLSLDSVVQIKPEDCNLLVVAKPTKPFSEQHKFVIDQYLMNGGRILWLIDRMDGDLDSLRGSVKKIPTDYPINLEDMLFKYGVRIQPDLIMDIECTKIPLQVGTVGNAPQFDLFKWFYHPAVQPSGRHATVKNMDRVELRFCSSIDTIRTKTPVNKTVLLTTSKYSKLQFSPIDINFRETVQLNPDPVKFNKGPQITGVLLEGVFPSAYQFRVSEEMRAGLAQLGIQAKEQSVPTRQIVISDGDVAANFLRDAEAKEWYPLGFNRFEKITYANKDLLLNIVEYLIDPNGVIEARTREVKIRPIDEIKARKNALWLRVLNIGLPLLFLGLFAFGFILLRRRRYTR